MRLPARLAVRAGPGAARFSPASRHPADSFGGPGPHEAHQLPGQDEAHLKDFDEAGLITAEIEAGLPPLLRDRLSRTRARE